MDLGIDGLTDVTLAGKGGTASVYKARNADGEAIAVKVFAGVWDDDRQRRFERELEALVILNQVKGVVNLYDYGQTASGVPYFTMPFQSGGSLQDVLKHEGPYSWPTAIGYVRDIASTLRQAHAQNIHHRDLKPANILLNSDGDPVITDFGITEIADGRSVSTIAGYTPGFCPPEMLTMGRGGVDGVSCDVYCLGTMLWSLLTAEQPFVGKGKNGVDPMVLLNRITTEALPKVESAPAWVNDVIAFATDKDPHHRYLSMGDLIDDLHAEGQAAFDHQEAGKTRSSPESLSSIAATNPAESGLKATSDWSSPAAGNPTEASTNNRSASILKFATSKKGYGLIGLAAVFLAAALAWPALSGNSKENAALGSEEGTESTVGPRGPVRGSDPDSPDTTTSTGSTTSAQVISDSELLASIRTLLPSGVTATVENGVATLTGEVATESEKASLQARVTAIEGVRSVQNNISVTEEDGALASPPPTETTSAPAEENATTTAAPSNPQIAVSEGEFYGEGHSAMAVSFRDFPPNATFRYTCITGQLGAPGQSYSTSFNITTDAQGNADRPGQVIGSMPELNCLVGPAGSSWVESFVNDPGNLALVRSNQLS